ncbi:hypothetical protein [Chitinimonas sp. BJYL2]|uniref:hypothetical protein n=1 Tax=Chitinimonas sp. BJYL2 TaxID=2976696 RepID=UPI0022B2D631|nr:hypothetical protein [Chitinimonas sp. BJYL2]
MVGLTRIAALTVVLWFVCAALGWAWYSSPFDKTLVVTRSPHFMPEVPQPPDLTQDVALLQRSLLWPTDQPSAQAAGKPAEPQVINEVWSRVAIVKEPQGNFVLLGSPSGTVKPFKAGDVLPDGSRLIKVSTSEIVVRPASGKSQSVHLLN